MVKDTKAKPASTKDEDKLARAKKLFERAEDAESENRTRGMDDLRFARLGEQWPEKIKAQREQEGRPCLTINRMASFMRQVVNDSRQNKPQIKVHPVDSNADPETAKVFADLIRNIERTSNADIAYDTAIESAVSYHVGYLRVGMDYDSEDTFDMDLRVERVANAAAIYGDPESTSADGSDWYNAFVVEPYTKEKFERLYGKKAQVDWGSAKWDEVQAPWKTDDHVLVAEWWERVETEHEVLLLSNGYTYSREQLEQDQDLLEVATAIEAGEISIVNSRMAKKCIVYQHIMTGAEIIETREWPGKFIPIVPVYGDEFDVAGERIVKSLIHDAVDAQRMFNYWRTTATELVALAPRVPYIGPKGSFDTDINAWKTANTVSHPFLEYDDKGAPPQRQPLDGGAAAGALQEALNASDDMKSILGIYDASLGARSNETSGKAIMARQREGDVSTFHFIDNLSRSIRHLAKILLDLIPHVYSQRKILRVIGEDEQPREVTMGEPVPVMGADGQPKMEDALDDNGDTIQQVVMAIHDLSVGKYDVTVSTGPSFTTRREEAAFQMTEAIRAVPAFGPLMIDKLAKVQDWPDAEEIAERAKKMVPGEQQLPPEVQQQVQQGQMAMQELAQLKTDKSIEMMKLELEQYKAETDRIKVRADVAKTGAEIDHMDKMPSKQNAA